MQVIYADEFSRIAVGGLSTIITKRSLYVEGRFQRRGVQKV